MKIFKITSLTFIALSLLIFSITSCKKDDESLDKQEIKTQNFIDVSYENGYLVFKHEGAIQSVTSAFVKDNMNATKQLQAQFPLFKSNFQASQELVEKTDLENVDENTFKNHAHLMIVETEKDGEKYLRRTIRAEVLSKICNEFGFFQVGDKLYQVTKDDIIEIDAISKKTIKRNKIEREEIDINQRALDTEIRFDCSGSRKFRGKIYKDNTWVYSETGAWCEYTKKNWLGTWVTTDATYMSFEGYIQEGRWDAFGGLCSLTNLNISNSGYNTGRVSRVANTCNFCCTNISLAGSQVDFNVYVCGQARGFRCE